MENQWYSQLRKLHITRSQWRTFFKWALYTAAFVATVVLQSVILSRMPVFGAKVNLVPYFVGCVCIIEGADSGSMFALLISLVWALSGGDMGYVSVLVLTCGGMGLGLLMRKLLRQQLVTCVVCCFVLSLCHESAIFLLRLFLDTATAAQYFRILIPGVLLGIPSCPVFFYLFRAIHRVGGNTWNA
ncbi:MAG: hypothetical protein E7464_03030 [Ruminococcaceae bacterium]|nr:hypothetical protein [Oscillospiraceae bacterium]